MEGTGRGGGGDWFNRYFEPGDDVPDHPNMPEDPSDPTVGASDLGPLYGDDSAEPGIEYQEPEGSMADEFWSGFTVEFDASSNLAALSFDQAELVDPEKRQEYDMAVVDIALSSLIQAMGLMDVEGQFMGELNSTQRDQLTDKLRALDELMFGSAEDYAAGLGQAGDAEGSAPARPGPGIADPDVGPKIAAAGNTLLSGAFEMFREGTMAVSRGLGMAIVPGWEQKAEQAQEALRLAKESADALIAAGAGDLAPEALATGQQTHDAAMAIFTSNRVLAESVQTLDAAKDALVPGTGLGEKVVAMQEVLTSDQGKEVLTHMMKTEPFARIALNQVLYNLAPTVGLSAGCMMGRRMLEGVGVPPQTARITMNAVYVTTMLTYAGATGGVGAVANHAALMVAPTVARHAFSAMAHPIETATRMGQTARSVMGAAQRSMGAVRNLTQRSRKTRVHMDDLRDAKAGKRPTPYGRRGQPAHILRPGKRGGPRGYGPALDDLLSEP